MAISASLINSSFTNIRYILLKHFIFYQLVVVCMHKCLKEYLKITVPHLFCFLLEKQHNYNSNIVELDE